MAVNGQRRRSPHLVVFGDNSLAYRLVEQLVTQTSDHVTVIVPPKERDYGPQFALISKSKVEVIEAQVLNEDVFSRAGAEQASAVALVSHDDVSNIHAALRVHKLNSRVRLVIRFNPDLCEHIRALFPDCVVLSDAETAARSFVAGALNKVSSGYVTLLGREGPDVPLYVARRQKLTENRVICELADTTSVPGQPDLLPDDRTKADLVLLRGDASARHRVHELLSALWWRVLASFSRKLVLVTVGLVVLLASLTVLFVIFGDGHVSWSEALYSTVLDAAGAAQPDPKLSPANKILQTVVTLIGISLIIPLITATVVSEVVRSRYPALARPRPIRGHVVLIGLGKVGTRVLAQLRDLNIPVLCVDSDENARGVLLARRTHTPIVFGDVSREDTLRHAYLDTCRALIAVTDDDITNFAAAMHGRKISKNEKLRVVARLFDDDLAKQAQDKFGIINTPSVSSLAAPEFAAAMLRREVFPISVERKVLLIAEVPIQAGSELHDVVSHDVDRVHETRVIAIRHEDNRLDLAVPSDYRLTSDDRLIIVATRAGLGQVLRRSGATGLGGQPG